MSEIQTVPKAPKIKEQPIILNNKAYISCTQKQKTNKKTWSVRFGLAIGFATLAFFLTIIFAGFIAMEESRIVFIVLTSIFALATLGLIGWLIPTTIKWVNYLKGNKTRAIVYDNDVIVYYRELDTRNIYINDKLIKKISNVEVVIAEHKNLTIKVCDSSIEFETKNKKVAYRW